VLLDFDIVSSETLFDSTDRELIGSPSRGIKVFPLSNTAIDLHEINSIFLIDDDVSQNNRSS